MKSLSLTIATPEDVPALVQLINQAYRGYRSRLGWTTEADLIDGTRIDEPALRTLLDNPAGQLIIGRYDEQLISCVYVEKQLDSLYLGMLTVDPQTQGQGIGKQMLAAADRYAEEQGCSAITMTVVAQRPELIAWYERHGFRPTGETLPFPKGVRFGVPRQTLTLLVLRKVL
ncbi:GNAT family N-acetyltransferase [Spirosoma pomorum]